MAGSTEALTPFYQIAEKRAPSAPAEIRFIEALQPFIKVLFVQNLLEHFVKRMTCSAGHSLMWYPHRLLSSLFFFPIAINPSLVRVFSSTDYTENDALLEVKAIGMRTFSTG